MNPNADLRCTWLLALMTLLVPISLSGCRPTLNSHREGTSAEFQITATQHDEAGDVSGYQSTSPEPDITPSLFPPSTRTPPPPLLTPLLDKFLFHDPTSNCQLPCWQDLVVGESTRDEVESVFNTVFGYDRDMFEDPGSGSVDQPELGLDTVEVRFSSDSYSLNIETYIDANTSILQAIALSWGTRGTELAPLTLQRTLQELGSPTSILAFIEVGQMNSAFVYLTTIYSEEGIALTTTEGILPDRTNLSHTGDGFEGTVGLCLAEVSINSASIVQPSTLEVGHVSPLQEFLFELPDRAIPLQEAFDVSLEEVTQLALNEENPCLFTDISRFQE